ncbi:MAG: hypothetical protein D6814_14190 [Calditrichaeota bacterium]|nr:MAG: hypothetical protein D6814_14190 [Calditrichota bacterium]
MHSKHEIEEENRKIRRLRTLVDLTAMLLAQPNTSILEAYGLIRFARNEALKMFPGKDSVFDLIYQPRFRRIVEAKLASQGDKLN